MKNSYLYSTITNKCPRCREGKLFTGSNPYDLSNITKMHERCPVCGQPTEIELGFYYGTGYVSYALTVAYFVSTFVAWKVLIGMTFDLDDNRIFLLDGHCHYNTAFYTTYTHAFIKVNLVGLVCLL